MNHTKAHPGVGTAALVLGALGIVYGDIGTSPLYAIRECFHGPHAVEATEANVLGILSMVFWSLTGVVCVKYLVFVLRADNRGEGGLFSLLALVPASATGWGGRATAGVLALMGVALISGEGILTPAISVLSAVEGLSVGTQAATPFVVPLTVAILVTLFTFQKRGTAGIGRVFGPITLVWFAAIGLLGLVSLAQTPLVLQALSPHHALGFMFRHGAYTPVILGSVVLAITGCEALYADLGHFGRKPIQIGWFVVAFPALLLNYLGQGAALLRDPSVAANPFYGLVPSVLLYPMVVLATAATVIASQALISGAFSIFRQAMQLGYFPRLRVVHTSEAIEGQIYLPAVNTALMLGCLALVFSFKASSGLAAAYGLAVTGTMTMTSLLFYLVATRRWTWPAWRAGLVVGLFLLFDLSYFGSCLLKFVAGGWIPLLLGLGVFMIMKTWKDGRTEISLRVSRRTVEVPTFLKEVREKNPGRVKGTAVFMSSNPEMTPVALIHHLRHYEVLHEQIVLLSVLFEDVPFATPEERLKVESLGNGFFRLVARYGYMESPNVPRILAAARLHGLPTDESWTSFFLGKEVVVPTGQFRMMSWRKRLFGFMMKNSLSATTYFDLPPSSVVELGLQIDL